MDEPSRVVRNIVSQEDIIHARQAGRELARKAGFGTVDQTRIATAISELVRNALLYAGGGACEVATEATDDLTTIRVVVSDDGPGIPDIDRAMEAGYSRNKGLGLGLPAVRRLMGVLHIDTHPGRTVVTTSMSRRL